MPSKHHKSSLRISPRGAAKRRGIDNPEGIDPDNLVILVDNPTNLATAMVVPQCHDRVYAKLLQGRGGTDMPRPQVHRSFNHQIDQRLNRDVSVPELRKGFGFYHVYQRLHALDALV